MDLTLTESEAAFKEEARTWLEANHPGPAPEGDDAAEFEFRRAWQKQLHDAGWAGLSWPEEYGGRGATLIEQAIFNEELGRQRVPLPANVLGLVMGGPVVIAHGREDQKERYLDPILSGDEIWCQGFSEPESGSDLASLKTRAVQSNGTWKVTGQKVWTTYAHEAKWCMLLARTDQDAPKHKGITYFILDMDQPGVEVRPLRQITGEAEFNEIFMEEAEVPDENVVGAVNDGWNVAITTLMFERAGLGAVAVMGLKRTLEDLIEMIRAKGLEADPVLRQKVAAIQTGIEAMRLGALRSLTMTMKTGIPGPEGSLGKWQWATYNQALTELASEVAGPDGVTVGTDWSYRFLRSRANSIEGGTTEVLQNIIAERVLGLPKLR
ncbi:MAG TPA: acyl-CoA dehydrogenase family protein [Solirubrobacterales bacterium]|nr:acyl-CoA dehydrogenase family protein [Solirubrobacterales bacterium]